MQSFYNHIDQYQERIALMKDSGEYITYHQLVADAKGKGLYQFSLMME